MLSSCSYSSPTHCPRGWKWEPAGNSHLSHLSLTDSLGSPGLLLNADRSPLLFLNSLCSREYCRGGQLRGGFCSHLIQVFSIHGFNWAFLYLCFSISSMRSWTNPVVHMLHLYIGAQGSFGDLEKQIRAIRSVIFSSLYLTHLKEKKIKGAKAILMLSQGFVQKCVTSCIWTEHRSGRSVWWMRAFPSGHTGSREKEQEGTKDKKLSKTCP